MIRSTAAQTQAEKIMAMVEKIADSGRAVDEYFRRHSVPFSRPQYFRYKARLAAHGLAGLMDGRSQGNQRKLTPEAEAFLRGAHDSDPQRSLEELA
jgi:Winged helix-turn helix